MRLRPAPDDPACRTSGLSRFPDLCAKQAINVVFRPAGKTDNVPGEGELFTTKTGVKPGMVRAVEATEVWWVTNAVKPGFWERADRE